MLLDLKRKNALGDYHLLLAHDVVAQKELYHEIFDDLDEQPFIIMDNSVIELGEPVSNEIMEEAVRIVRTDLVVLPDAIADPKRTIEMSTETALLWRSEGIDTGFLCVPQGTTMGEFTDCAEQLMKLPGVQAWGVPRHATAKLGTRHHLVYALMVLKPMFTMHLLGFSDNLVDDISVARATGVNGIDSAVPIRLGLLDEPFHTHIDSHPPRGDYWEAAKEATPTVLENLAKIRGWITP
jgi:hypothetical protein